MENLKNTPTIEETDTIWQGSFASAPANPQNGWAYKNTSDNKSYKYFNNKWYQMIIHTKITVKYLNIAE